MAWSVLRDHNGAGRPREQAAEADIIAILPVHAGDNRILSVPGTMPGRDLPSMQFGERRPRDDAAGVVAHEAVEIGVGRLHEQEQPGHGSDYRGSHGSLVDR